jgi:predicted nuclease of predicted toxin-antitoxin system
VRFLLDHDVPADIRILEQEGHTAVPLASVVSPSTNDLDVLLYATTHGMALITCNRNDFLDLTRSRTHPGLIILIRRRTRQMEFARLLSLLRHSGENGIRGNVNYA